MRNPAMRELAKIYEDSPTDNKSREVVILGCGVGGVIERKELKRLTKISRDTFYNPLRHYARAVRVCNILMERRYSH